MNNAVTEGFERPLLFNGAGAFDLGKMIAPRRLGEQGISTSSSNDRGKITQAGLNVNENDYHL